MLFAVAGHFDKQHGETTNLRPPRRDEELGCLSSGGNRARQNERPCEKQMRDD